MPRLIDFAGCALRQVTPFRGAALLHLGLLSLLGSPGTVARTEVGAEAAASN
jgi:hypothetical protein